MARGNDSPGEKDSSLPNVRRETFEEKVAGRFEDDISDLSCLLAFDNEMDRLRLTP